MVSTAISRKSNLDTANANKPSSIKDADPQHIDGKSVRELAEVLADTGLAEIEYETETHRIRLAKHSSAPMMAAPMQPAHQAPMSAPAVTVNTTAAATNQETPAAAPAVDLSNAVKSPLVGTAYMASQPDAPAFVKVGDTVKEGDTLLIVEAMKIMNPIKAPKAGKVTQILVSDAAPVEYDEPLVVVE